MIKAKLSSAPISAQKARLVLDQIRSMPVGVALDQLNFSNKKAAHLVKKLLESAIANAENNEGMDVDELIVATTFADEAASYKRFRSRAKGRANHITKRNCHITVAVAPKQTKRERR